MKLYEINPFVRFARNNEKSFFNTKMTAADHRIFFVFNGRASITLNSECFEVEKGDIIYWHSGCTYAVKTFENAEFSGLNFDFTQNNNHITAPFAPTSITKAENTLEQFNFEDVEIFNSYFVIKNGFSLAGKFSEIVEEYEKREIYFNERCSAILKDILTFCARFSAISHNSKTSRLAQEVLLYIRNNYKTGITNDIIAAHFSYHPNYLNNLILQHTGTSMHRYLLNYRMNKAVELLQTTSFSITKIAEEVGISDIKHFSKLFKNTVGVPPSYYKKYNLKSIDKL
ncbi:MAG: helix-turn-helix domain-containing protein [Clostridia bacterium]|nr:helix-turn-helix domain-containing protein [Clostridia bacterium]